MRTSRQKPKAFIFTCELMYNTLINEFMNKGNDLLLTYVMNSFEYFA